MSEYVYVDNSNVFIEGQRVAAVRSNMAMDIYDAMQNGALDFSYKMDFGKLHAFICGVDKTQIKRAVLFGSRPPPNDSIWKFAELIEDGFKVDVVFWGHCSRELREVATNFVDLDNHFEHLRL